MKAITSINGNVEVVNLPDNARNWTKLDSPSESESTSASKRQDSWDKALTPNIVKSKKLRT
tara:strand:+ start:220 stop:402 length:183 start_codon:yes stop_codon:yes gene_type:complete